MANYSQDSAASPANTNTRTAQPVRGGNGDSVYLVEPAIFDPGHSTASALACYKVISNGGNQDQQPDAFKLLTGPVAGNDGDFNWDDADENHATFLDGMTFTWTMSGNALNAPTFSQVGTSSNSDGSMWDIYRDDDCTLRVADNGYVSAIEAYTVTSRFWCF